MNNQDYETKKRECWDEYCKTHPLCNTSVMRLNFDWTFDRAYALGKQEKDAEKKDRAMRKALYLYRYGGMHDPDDWTRDTVKPSDNFEKGFMAGYTACEQSMWRSVDEELPEDDRLVLAHFSDVEPELSYATAYHKDGAWNTPDDWYYDCKIDYWMQITPPSIPDTNTK